MAVLKEDSKEYRNLVNPRGGGPRPARGTVIGLEAAVISGRGPGDAGYAAVDGVGGARQRSCCRSWPGRPPGAPADHHAVDDDAADPGDQRRRDRGPCDVPEAR